MLRTIVIVLNLLALGCLVAHGSESSHTKKDTNTMQRASKNPIMCPGQFQSPIALDSNSATYLGAESEAVVDISESATHKTYLVANYGYFLEVFVIKGAWKITLNPKAKNYYKADGLRFFWRSVYTRGTEHTLDGESFPLEMHILATPSTQTDGSISSAPGSLAVIVILFKLTPDQSKSSLSKIGNVLSNIGKIKPEGSNDEGNFLNTDVLLPQNRKEFLRYQGPLNTKPCTKNIQWTVLRQPLEVTEADLKQLRSLQFGVGDDAKPMQDNFRPVQQLNAVLAPQPRMLYKSWPSTAGRIAPALFVLTLHLTIITFSN